MIKPIPPYPALLVVNKNERTLIVADLHIGWEVPLTKEGVHVPSQTAKLQEKLFKIIKKVKPRTVLFLGDVKHTIAKAEVEEWKDIPEFFEALTRIVKEILVIPGNHDGNLEPLLPESVKILPSTGIKIKNTGVFHGHTWPSPELLECKNLVIGHLHPVVVLRDPLGFKITSQVWVKAKCNSVKLAEALLKKVHGKAGDNSIETFREIFHKIPRTSQIFVMPAFNDFLGGQPVNVSSVGKEEKYRDFIGPILRSRTINMDDAEIYMLDGTFLGTIHQLRMLA